MASSVLEKLNTFYPQSKISILVSYPNECLFKEHPFLHKVLVLNNNTTKLNNTFTLLRKIRLSKFDTVINLSYDAISGFLTVLSKANYLSGFDKNPFSFLYNSKIKHSVIDGNHQTKRLNDLIEQLTDNEICKPKLYPSFKHFLKIESYIQTPFIIIVPHAEFFTKQLPTYKWIELCDRINKEITIYLIGDATDDEQCGQIKTQSLHPQIINLTCTFNLLEIAELMKYAKNNYVNDSFYLQLASSVNAPTTAFYCSTIPAYGFYSLSYNSTIIQINENLSCRSCGLNGYNVCPKQHFKCGNDIKITTVDFTSV